MFKTTISCSNDFSRYKISQEDSYIVAEIEFFGEVKRYPKSKEIKEQIIEFLKEHGYNWYDETTKIVVTVILNFGEKFWKTSEECDQYYTAVINDMTLDEKHTREFTFSRIHDTNKAKLETSTTFKQVPSHA